MYSTENMNVSGEKPLIYVTPENTVHMSIASDKNQFAQVGIYDLSGKMIKTNEIEILKGNNTFSINANGLNAGVYIIALASEANVCSEKINLN